MPAPGEVIGSELQTLISTLQNGNQQLGHLYRATAGITPAMSAMSAAVTSIAQAALPLQMGGIANRVGGSGAAGPLPPAPDGYITVNIPGVGQRLIPFYPLA